MKINETRCPNCGANLKIDSNTKVCRCEYCGNKFVASFDEDEIASASNLDSATSFNEKLFYSHDGKDLSVLSLYDDSHFTLTNHPLYILKKYNLTKDNMETLPKIYDSLSSEEKEKIRSFDVELYKRALAVFAIISEIYAANNLIEGPYSAKSIEEEELIYLDDVADFDKQIGKINYDMGGLGLFNMSKKKELKNNIVNLEKQKDIVNKKHDLYKTEVELYATQAKKMMLDRIAKIRGEEMKADYKNTPFTAFKRRAELKENYAKFMENYKLNVKQCDLSINNLNSSIKTLKKQLKNI